MKRFLKSIETSAIVALSNDEAVEKFLINGFFEVDGSNPETAKKISVKTKDVEADKKAEAEARKAKAEADKLARKQEMEQKIANEKIASEKADKEKAEAKKAEKAKLEEANKKNKKSEETPEDVKSDSKNIDNIINV